ncbi:MAG TPA: acetate/propionate family kinase [Rhodospirillaceae bacterium]|nr:acetate/propionate family kinase [Rhodospirillaceae bacterium]
MSAGILVINAGSSSIKFSLYVRQGGGSLELSSRGQVEGIGVAPSFEAKSPDGALLAEQHWDKSTDRPSLLGHLVEWIESHLDGAELKAAGHRVVHGGRRFAAPMLIDDTVYSELERLIPLAPLHQPHNLAAIDALRKLHPKLAQVACFDTAFHRTHDALASGFALPRALIDEGVQRYGFHGLSYEYIAKRLRQLAPEVAKGRVVVCHLGSGASMCAIDNGRSVASTMGFTALDGLPMGTRPGQLDPGVILYLLQEKKMTAKEIETLLYHKSGLLGMSGVSNDMRVLMTSDDVHAREAVDYFVYRIGREIGSLAAAMNGIDALVFTAGIGERSTEIRARVVERAAWLGFAVDETANLSGEGLISPAGAKVSTWVIPTNEELMIADHTVEVMEARASALVT